MITISLNGAEFFAYHGFYPEEQKLGCKFIVDIEVGFTPPQNLKADKISHTVDYEQLYKITCEQMRITRKLIETVAQAIVDDIKARFPFADQIKVSMRKMNPPLGGIVASSCIVITA